MNYTFIVFLFLTGAQPRAESKGPTIKSWKKFQSDVGYEFKYPDCWEIRIDEPHDPNKETPLRTIRSIEVEETPRCARPRFSSSSPNGIGFMGGYGPRNKMADALKEIKLREKNSIASIQRKDQLAFKKFKLGVDDAIVWVQVEHGYIHWQIKVYCPDWWISADGPSIDNENIDKSYYEKFKKGDLAMPEPEKTILESIRCIPPKQK